MPCDKKVEGSIPILVNFLHCISVKKLSLSVGFLTYVRNKVTKKISWVILQGNKVAK